MIFAKSRLLIGCLSALFLVVARVEAQSSPDLVQQIAEVMSQAPSGKAHQRYVHAKGIVCQGSFQASPDGQFISRAAHFDGKTNPLRCDSPMAPRTRLLPIMRRKRRRAAWLSDLPSKEKPTSWRFHTTDSLLAQVKSSWR